MTDRKVTVNEADEADLIRPINGLWHIERVRWATRAAWSSAWCGRNMQPVERSRSEATGPHCEHCVIKQAKGAA